MASRHHVEVVTLAWGLAFRGEALPAEQLDAVTVTYGPVVWSERSWSGWQQLGAFAWAWNTFDSS